MKIALYMRLSRADGPDAESNSITNQRIMLKEYAQKNFPGRVCEEFVDDGYSGGNFDRPAFKRMIVDCRKGIVDTIIVKDLSRFGRNNVDVSDYVEQIFPLLGVQLVSILDKYDAAKSKDGLMDMEPSARARPVRTMSESVHSTRIPLVSRKVSMTCMPILLFPSRNA